MLNTPHDGRSLSRRSLLTRSAFAVGAAAAGITLPVACGSDSATTSGGDAEGGGTRETTFLSPIPLDPLSLAPGLLAVAGGGEARGCARPDDGRAVRGRNQRQGRLAGARRRRPRPPARASGRRPRTEHVRPGTAGPDRGLRGEHRHREHPDRPESRRRGLRPSEYVKSGSQLHATTKEGLTKEADNPRAFLAAIHEAMALDPKKPPLVTDEAAGAAGYKELTDAGLLPPGGDPKSWFDNSLLPKS